MIRQIKNLFSASSLRTHLSGSIEFIGLTKHFHRTLPQIFIFLFLLIFLSFNCSTNEPPPDTGAITLVVEDASCIEAWINLKAENITLPAAVTLKQSENNGEEKVRQVINLTTADTLLFIDSLLPKRSYKFKAEWINNSGKLKTAEAAVVTMDTTSHNFTWQTFTFGQHSSSVLYDVAIIDENNIWAVGEIYMNDSLGNPDPHAYNAVHWDGSEWKVKRIYTYSSCNAVDYAPLKAICFFSDTSIVVTSGGSIGWFNGTNNKPDCSIRPLLTGSINKLWGSSSNDMYAVGNGGNIAHWDGISWKKIESGTDVELFDVWGSPEGNVVWTCGYYYDRGGTYLLRSYGGSFEMAYDGTANQIRILSDTISGSLASVYTSSSKKIFLATTTGVYSAETETKGKWRRLSFTQTFFPGLPFRMRGTELNDFTIVGEYALIAHYNGYGWRYFNELWTDNIRFRSVSQKNDLSVIVGSQYLSPIYSPALIYLGKR